MTATTPPPRTTVARNLSAPVSALPPMRFRNKLPRETIVRSKKATTTSLANVATWKVEVATPN